MSFVAGIGPLSVDGIKQPLMFVAIEATVTYGYLCLTLTLTSVLGCPIECSYIIKYTSLVNSCSTVAVTDELSWVAVLCKSIKLVTWRCLKLIEKRCFGGALHKKIERG
jgi:hypothetical protein